MIAILGKKRLIILAALVVINAVIAVQIYASIAPQTQITERDIKTTRSRLGVLYNELDQLQVSFEDLVKKQERFESLKEQGFFGRQSRYEAGRVFEDIQERSKVISAKVTVKGGEVLENEAVIQAGYRILRSMISIEVEALDDMDIFHYVSLLEHDMPGYIAVQKVTLERVGALDEKTLKAVSDDLSPVLVKALIEVTWTTMIPEALVVEKPEEGMR